MPMTAQAQMSPRAAQPADRFLRRPTVEQMCGLGTSTLYYLMGQGEFPGNVRLGRRIVAWRESEIVAWLANRPGYQPKALK